MGKPPYSSFMKETLIAVLIVVLGFVTGTYETLQAQLTLPLVKQGDPAPGFIDFTVFSTSGVPAINDSLFTAFHASVIGLNPTATAAIGINNSGIWASNAAGLQLVVQAGSTAPGTTGAVFSTFSDPVYNNANAVAFQGTLRAGIGDVVTVPTAANPVNNSIGIWSTYGGVLQLVARQGQQAPGMAAPVLFSSFSQFVLPDQGGVAFLANLIGTGIFPTNNQGIWAVNTAGVLQLIMTKGSRVNGKTITALSFLTTVAAEGGQKRDYAQNSGDLLIKCTFSDTTWGIVRVVFP